MVEAHEGQVAVRSEEGKGAEFIVTLPVEYRNGKRAGGTAALPATAHVG